MRATTNCTFRLSFSFDSRFSLPLALFLPFAGSEQTGKCSSGPPLLFLFHAAYLHLSSFVIILHARITKTTHSGSVQFRLLVRTIAIFQPTARSFRYPGPELSFSSSYSRLHALFHRVLSDRVKLNLTLCRTNSNTRQTISR